MLHAVGPHSPGLNTPKFAGLFGTAEQATEKLAQFVIPGEARNLSLAETQEKRDSSHKKRAMENRTSLRRLRSE